MWIAPGRADHLQDKLFRAFPGREGILSPFMLYRAAMVAENWVTARSATRTQLLAVAGPVRIIATKANSPIRFICFLSCCDFNSLSAHLCLTRCNELLVPADDVAGGREAHGDPQDAGHLLAHLCDQLRFLLVGTQVGQPEV